jgi:hypothetical protein
MSTGSRLRPQTTKACSDRRRFGMLRYREFRRLLPRALPCASWRALHASRVPAIGRFRVPIAYPEGIFQLFWDMQSSYKPLILFGSPGRTRTSDPAVNSRLLYRLSYRGTWGRLSSASLPLWLPKCPDSGQEFLDRRTSRYPRRPIRALQKSGFSAILVRSKERRAGCEPGPKALGNGGVSSREDSAKVPLRG